MKHVLQFAVILILLNCKPNMVGQSNNPTTPPRPSTFVFEMQNSGCSASLRGVMAVSSKIVWASGSNATYLRTINGGEIWNMGKIDDADGPDFRDVQAFNADTAILLSAGAPARIYKTTDGGKNWHKTYYNNEKGVFFNSMAFWDEFNGVAFSDPVAGNFLIIVTNDGGETWKQVPKENIPQPLPGEAGFAASGTSIAVNGKNTAWFATGGSVSRVFKSTDKGITWTASIIPILNKGESTGIYSIAFIDSLLGIAVGGDWQKPSDTSNNIFITKNGGISWVRPVSAPSGFRSCISFVRNKEGLAVIAVGSNGSDISLDHGENWKLLDTIGYNSIHFLPNIPIGWAIGSDGRVTKVEDYN